MGRRFLVIICVVLLVGVGNVIAYERPVSLPIPEGVAPFEGEISGKSALLMDMGSGTVLYEYNADVELPLASVTKTMSILLIMEALKKGQISYSEDIIVSDAAYKAGTRGSSIFLEPGEIATVEELLLAVVVGSANDATVALAEQIFGSEEAFVYAMNAKAKELEMNQTHFVDATGLNDEAYSTAYDIALMSRELMQTYYAELKDYLQIYLTYYKDGTSDRAEVLNTNRKFMRSYDRATGLKTGWTTLAGYCLSATAVSGSLHLNAVVLGCTTSQARLNDVVKLMNYGFSHYDAIHVAEEGVAVAEVIVDKGVDKWVSAVSLQTVSSLVKAGTDPTHIEQKVELKQFVTAPVNKGTKVGEIIVKHNETIIDRVDLVAANDVPRAGLLQLIKKILRSWSTR